jgi:transcriptional regulator with XRE-family HTH domain
LRCTGQPYNGVNVLVLWLTAFEKGYTCPLWLTFQQAKELGRHVKKGEKGTTVVYANTFEKKSQDGARLRELRQARETTQADLARDAQVALSHLSKLEKGEAAPGLDLIERLATALRTTVVDLLPQPAVANAEGQRDQIRKAFEAVLTKAGGETLRLLELFLARLAESPSSKR